MSIVKIIISGSRYITDYDLVAQTIIESGFTPTLIVEGGQRTYDKKFLKGLVPVGGVDFHAFTYAQRHGIPWKQFPAEWKKHGLAAGPIRNREMAVFGDALIAIPKGVSKGTRNMILAMTMQGKPIFVKEV